ncbi:MAG: hypothetical protein QE283_07125 [Rhodoferax sp.]|nr:hypothetical protein [Rhodoferax sp.]
MPASRPLNPRASAISLASPAGKIRLLGTLLMLATALSVLPAPGHAAPSAVAAEPGTSAVAPMARSYLPKPSETLDQVVARTLPDSPLRIELLRQAFIAYNPQAFAPGKVPKLRKGVALTVPDHDDLLRMHLGSRLAPVEVVPSPPRYAPSTSEERKRWVQFP